MATKMLNSINNVEDILGYTFIDSTYLWEALQAPGSGVSVVGTRRIYDGNKRLALRGDSAIRIIIVKDWFSTDCSRAVADSILQSQVSNNNLQRICKLHGLERYINLNPSSRGSISPRTMYDTMEAILGAVAEDGGEEELRAVMVRLGFVWHDNE